MDATRDKPAVSIVMATFNGARFIAAQLESLRRQTHPPRELIVSDDGSTDCTIELVEQFRARAPFPVTIHRNEMRLGYGANFLSALRHASAEYIAFCDQDDVWHPEKLQRALDALLRERADLFVHRAVLIDDHDVELGEFTQGITAQCVFPPLRLAPWGVFYGFSMVFRRDVVEIIDPSRRGGHTFEFQGLLSHDLWVYFLCSSIGRVVTHDEPLARYRQHDGNQTPHVTGRWFRTWKQSLGTAAHPELRRDLIANSRAVLMAELSRAGSASDRSCRAAEAAVYWRRIAKFEASRIRLYTARTLWSRAASCLGLVVAGGYLPWTWRGLGPRLLLKDALVGVCQARRWTAAAATLR